MGNTPTQNRIWELDALRGLLIPGMILIHLIYDAVDLYQFVDWPYPEWYSLFKNNYGALFVFLSGVCVTLGSRSVKRGLTVFAGGMVCTIATWGMYLLGMAGKGIIIYFGVLHCLGVCMMLWSAFRRCKSWQLAVLGAVLAASGWWIRYRVLAETPCLMPLGFVYPGFASSDYFPLMPNLGYFLLGAALGKKLYREKKTLLPDFPAEHPVVRFFRFCGRHSLTIYLAHQPVLAGLCELLVYSRKL